MKVTPHIRPQAPWRRLRAWLFASEESQDIGEQRDARIVQGVFVAVLSRSIGVITNLVAIPLTIGYLGQERYGIWVMINTIVIWLSLADLGVGNGLVNAVARAEGQRDVPLARRYISGGFLLLSSIVAAIAAVTMALASRVDLAAILNVQSTLARAEIGPAVVLAILIILAGFPFSLVRKILEATQEGGKAYAWSALSSLASLVALLIVTRFEGGLIWLVIAVLGTQSLTAVASAVWLFGWHRPDLRPRRHAVQSDVLADLAKNGGAFFAVQALALLNLSSDTFIIARFLGLAQITPYNVTWQLFSYTTLLQALAFPLVWSALAAADGRGDRDWIRRTYVLFLLCSVLSTAVLALPLAFVAQPLIGRWVGPATVPPAGLAAIMALWSLLLAVMNSSACLLNSQGRLRGQLIYGTLTAAANISLSIALAPVYGINGVILATVIAYAIFALVPQQIETLLILRRHDERG